MSITISLEQKYPKGLPTCFLLSTGFQQGWKKTLRASIINYTLQVFKQWSVFLNLHWQTMYMYSVWNKNYLQIELYYNVQRQSKKGIWNLVYKNTHSHQNCCIQLCWCAVAQGLSLSFNSWTCLCLTPTRNNNNVGTM